MKKIIFLYILITILFLNNTFARDILVPQDYNTIQKAVDEALPEDKIIISEGIYREVIKSSRPIQIEGHDPEKTIIEGELAIKVTDSNFSQNKTVIRNLGFAAANVGIGATKNDDVLIENCRIKGANTYGIAIYENKKAVVKDCIVSECNAIGLYGNDIEEMSVSTNYSHNNGRQGGGIGIGIYNVRLCFLNNNISSFNKSDGIQMGIIGKVFVNGNKCSGNELSGINVFEGNDIQISENNISNNQMGINFVQSNGIIKKNRSVQNRDSGILLANTIKNTGNIFDSNHQIDWTKTKIRIAENNLSENKINGMSVYNCNSLLVAERNRCHDNNDSGIKIWDSPGSINFSKNICMNNKVQGIMALRSGRFLISENRISENSGLGIYLTFCDYSTIVNNKTSQNKTGIFADSTQCLVENNYSINNRQNGIYLRESEEKYTASSKPDIPEWSKVRTRILNNNCVNNGARGIILYYWKKPAVIAKNNCQYNLMGIRILNTYAPAHISNNTLKFNTSDGIEINDSAFTFVEENIIENNYTGLTIYESKAEAYISKNLISKNYSTGIHISSGGQAVIQSNLIEANNAEGVKIFGDPNAWANVIGNTLRKNYHSGIFFINGAIGEIRDNECSEHPWSGIAIRGEGTKPLVSGNKCFKNKCWGIIYWDNAEPQIDENIVFDNGMGSIHNWKKYNKINLYEDSDF